MTFPQNFVWGAATSAYQIEGAAFEDGKGLSIWDEFCRTPGAIPNGDTGEIACDHYHHFRGDVQLMKQIGLQAYRFSISWARIFPSGTGQINHQGIDFYSSLVDELLAAGITPYATLFHWDLPLGIQERGGWLQRDSAGWFADYAHVMTKHLGDRVKNWITINEPTIFLKYGSVQGIHAPGNHWSEKEYICAAHHVLLSHGTAVQAVRAASDAQTKIGFAFVGSAMVPASPADDDVRAAKAATFAVGSDLEFSNAWWMDPILLGSYPEDGRERYGKFLPAGAAADLRVIHEPVDFMGFNTYSGIKIAAERGGGFREVPFAKDHPVTAFNWYIVPESLYWTSRFFTERYHIPLYVTENGMSNDDRVSVDGCVHDPERIAFLRSYLTRLGDAVADGADVRGYFHWSLLDNFEWAAGMTQRFGLVYVDFATQERTLKDSADWYRKVIEANRIY